MQQLTCARSWLPTARSPLPCPPHRILALRNQKRKKKKKKHRQQKRPEERFLDYFILLHLDGEINAASSSIILGGYVYIVKQIHPTKSGNSEYGSHFSERSLLVTQRWSRLGGGTEEER